MMFKVSASVDNLNSARKQRFGLSLSAPAPESEAESSEPAPMPPIRPGVGSEYSPARRSLTSLFRWPGVPERSVTPRPLREPFERLKFWTVSHELTRRLKPYQVTDVSLMFRQATWGTLVYWSLLLDGIEIEEPVLV